MQLVLKIILLSTLVGLGYSKPHRFNSFDSNNVISNTGLGYLGAPLTTNTWNHEEFSNPIWSDGLQNSWSSFPDPVSQPITTLDTWTGSGHSGAALDTCTGCSHSGATLDAWTGSGHSGATLDTWQQPEVSYLGPEFESQPANIWSAVPWRCLNQYVQQHQEYSQQPLQHQFIQQQQQFPQQQFYQHGHSYNNYMPSSHQGGMSWPGAIPSSSSVGSQHPISPSPYKPGACRGCGPTCKHDCGCPEMSYVRQLIREGRYRAEEWRHT